MTGEQRRHWRDRTHRRRSFDAERAGIETAKVLQMRQALARHFC
jgi:hypothetical protein